MASPEVKVDADEPTLLTHLWYQMQHFISTKEWFICLTHTYSSNKKQRQCQITQWGNAFQQLQEIISSWKTEKEREKNAQTSSVFHFKYAANTHAHTQLGQQNNQPYQVTHVVLYYHFSCINTTFNKLSQQWGRYSRHSTVLGKIQHMHTHTVHTYTRTHANTHRTGLRILL